jgi:hypothetical protein
MECIRERLENAIEGKSDEKDATWLKGHLGRRGVWSPPCSRSPSRIVAGTSDINNLRKMEKIAYFVWEEN